MTIHTGLPGLSGRARGIYIVLCFGSRACVCWEAFVWDCVRPVCVHIGASLHNFCVCTCVDLYIGKILYCMCDAVYMYVSTTCLGISMTV